jgi:hypothetical protein
LIYSAYVATTRSPSFVTGSSGSGRGNFSGPTTSGDAGAMRAAEEPELATARQLQEQQDQQALSGTATETAGYLLACVGGWVFVLSDAALAFKLFRYSGDNKDPTGGLMGPSVMYSYYAAQLLIALSAYIHEPTSSATSSALSDDLGEEERILVEEEGGRRSGGGENGTRQKLLSQK